MRRRFVGAVHITVRLIRANQDVAEEVVRRHEHTTAGKVHLNAILYDDATKEGFAGEGTENHDDTPEMATCRAHRRYNGLIDW